MGLTGIDFRVDTDLADETDLYLLIVLNSAGDHLLVSDDNEACCLPNVRIPRFMRVAEQVTTAVRRDWGVITALLSSNSIDGADDNLAVLEVLEEVGQLPAELKWVTLHEVLSTAGAPYANLIERCHAKALKIRFGSDPEPFSRLGWMCRLQSWIRGVIAPFGIALKDFVQLNGSESFSLLRFETNGKPLWFKATGEPNLHELPLTCSLAKLFPEYLPKIIAVDPVLNGWLMESSGDYTLSDKESPDDWRAAVQHLGRLQIVSAPHVGELLDVTRRDCRIESLRNHISSFFEVIAKLMEQQTKTQPAPLSREDLQKLTVTIEDALSLLANLKIPDTLGHTDFNPGNILLDGSGCVFIDWAEAHVGQPLLTFEYFLAHHRRSSSRQLGGSGQLRDAYVEALSPLASSAIINEALLLSPLVAAYAYASSGKAWRDPNRLASPRVAAHLRSLARRMNLEAELLLQRSESCLQN